MKLIKQLLYLLLGSLIAISCIRAEAVSYDQVSREPKPDAYEMNILQKEKITKDYKVIGEVSANGPNYRSEKILKKLKDKARKMGGDALLSFQSGNAGAGVYNSDTGTAMYNSTAKDVYKAKVIIWENE